ncbi:MAG: cell wall-binding repeat-containing protein [Chloroflexota bacterium]|nr:MAG: cell wall-binding repeat-containing protein [Chloroflexota bacterium]
MRNLARLLAFALVFGLLAATPVAAATSNPSAAGAADVNATTKSTAKVVIIVGATHSATSNYRSIADSAYAEAIKWSSNVVKIYSPYATWAAVKPALQGASVVVYLGHGNGWPSPYTYDAAYTTKDGLGLNATSGNGDNNVKYYGEPSLANEIRLAPNAVVLLNHLCYASGNSEPGDADPTLSVAMQRVDNYGQGFIKAGARAVIAEGHGSINGMIRDLFTTHQTVLDVWRNQSNYHGNEFSFQSTRSPAYSAFMDPDSTSGGYYRSLIGNPDISTDDVTAVPYVRTDSAPDSLTNPGAATSGASGATLYASADLSSPTGSLDPGRAVRVNDTASDPNSAAYVQALTGSGSGWTTPASLVPEDSAGPKLWGADGPRTLSPNGDGVADALNVGLRFSESVTWTVEFRDGSGTKRWEAAGSGETATLAWDLKVGSTTVPDGAYALRVRASDPWGNPQLVTDVPFVVDTTAPARLAGVDRYATAAAISAANYDPNVPIAYLATGLNFPDALAGAAAAGSQHAPILLVTRDAIPAATKNELNRLKPGRIIVLGSTGAVSAAVSTAAAAYTSGGVTRLAGVDRYATAAAISAATYAPGVSVAYIATGLNFPDALAGAAAAGSTGAPILLVGQNTIPTATADELTRLAPGRIVVLGASGVVSDGVAASLGAFTSGSVTRLAGVNRYATAAAISAATYAPGVSVVYLATGANFPDALAGAAAAGSQGAPILLVTRDSIPSATAAELQRLNPGRVVILGSMGVVSEAVRILVQQYLG